MSDSEEEETYNFYGTPLEQYDEDAFPKKRPITIEEQTATDAQGRRRFHGAFTGGFSAGFFNTVGSLEGWTPSEFRSSRSEKSQSTIHKPEDFMDEEDRSEFGIAPETIRATKDYNTSKKRKKQMFTAGPIPGEPVLQMLIESGNETIGYHLLKNIGLKHGSNEVDDEATSGKVYGCEMPTKFEIRRSETTSNIPKIYEEYIKSPKANSFGMGYSGLDKTHINLFQSTSVVSREKNKKGFSISGQAFGVGAFEQEDDDIYAKDDLSNYDFELTSEKTKKISGPLKESNKISDWFILSTQPLVCQEKYPLPNIPRDYVAKYKKSTSETEEPIKRAQMNSLLRSKYLGEDTSNVTFTKSYDARNLNKAILQTPAKSDLRNTSGSSSQNYQASSIPKNDLLSNLLVDRFVTASQSDEHTKILEPVKRSETTHGTKEMREAARMKLFGPLTRVYLTWTPCSLLCKRFNVPEPKYDENPRKEKRRNKHLIFEYQKENDEDTALKPGLSIKKEPISEDIIEQEEIPIEPSQSTSSIQSIEASTSNSIEENKTFEESFEKALDTTEKIDVEKNIDLFKAVFLSSSESENESEVEDKSGDKKDERNEEIVSNVLGETLIPKIKPSKLGILSNIVFTKVSSRRNNDTTINNVQEKHEKSDGTNRDETSKPEQKDDGYYGPKLPDRISTVAAKSVSKTKSSSEDEWVEKDKHDHKKSHKSKKKHKKEKHKKKHKKKDRR